MASIGIMTKGIQSKVKSIGPIESVIIEYPLQGEIQQINELNGTVEIQYQLNGVIEKEEEL